MARPTLPRIARLLSPATRPLRSPRRAQVLGVRLLATAGQQQPQQPGAIIERYRSKLDDKAKEAGVGSIDELKEAYSDKIADLRRKDAVADPVPGGPPKDTTTTNTTAQGAPTATTPPPSKGPAGAKPLSSFLDLEKSRHLPEKELAAIWRLRHAESPLTLCASIPRATYLAMETAARSAPQFVLPVPHPEQGAEMHFLEWSFDPETSTSTVLFTQLAEYKARAEFAQPHTTVTHHLDLAADAGVVLMQGQLVEGRGAKMDDARFLVLALQKFYGAWGDRGEARQLLEWFAAGDARFTAEKLLEEAERLA